MSLSRHLVAFLLGLTMLGAVAVAQQDDPPLGDVARQQSGQKAVKTFDDDNFQRTVPPPPAADAKPADAAKSGGAKDASAKKADAEPSAEVKALEKQLADLKKNRDFFASQITILQGRIDGSSLDSDIRESLMGAQAGYKEQLAEADAELAKVQKQLDAARAGQKPTSGDASGGGDTSKPAEAKPGDSEPAKTQ